MNMLVTKGAGFTGSALCRHLVSVAENVLRGDKLTYADNLVSPRSTESCRNCRPVNSGLTCFGDDRRGHDRRCAMNTAKIESRLGWKPICEDTCAGVRLDRLAVVQ